MFSQGNLVVWNVDGNYPVVLVSCGGGHRSCDLKFDEQGGQFIFIQSRKIMKAVWTTATQQIILQVNFNVWKMLLYISYRLGTI